MPGLEFGETVADVGQQLGAGHDVESFLQRLEIRDAQYDGCRTSVFGDDHPVVFPFDLIHHFGQVVFHVAQGHQRIHGHSYKCSHIPFPLDVRPGQDATASAVHCA